MDVYAADVALIEKLPTGAMEGAVPRGERFFSTEALASLC